MKKKTRKKAKTNKDADTPCMGFCVAPIHCTTFNFTLCRPYADDGSIIIEQILERIENILTELHITCFRICVDFNNHH